MGKLLLKAVGGPFTENIYDEFEALTDRAILDVDLIEYDEESRQVVIPLTRLPIVPGQKKVFRRITQYAQDKNQETACVVTVRNVTDFKMETFFEEDEDRKINLIFGITIKDNNVFMSSVQEVRGKHLFGLSIETNSLDIEIRDV